MTARFHHRLSFGAELEDGGSVRFRLWAPGETSVSLVLETKGGETRLAMAPEAEGWFGLASQDARAGSRYRYELGDGLRVPDPASRFQPEDVGGPSQVIDPLHYRWHHSDWAGRPWEEAVVYEAHLGCFSRQGGFDGARRHLDHLARLGVTALEIMPIADFEGRRNWGYDGVLPFAPDSSYGAPDALKRLIDEAHGRELMVLLDVVYNHFGPSGNYLGRYAPQFFTDRHHTPWGKAIAFDGEHSRPVRDFFIQNALYWLEEYRFDGLRLDAVHAILDDSRPDILEELATAVRSHLAGKRRVHLVLENDDNAAHYLARIGAAPRAYTAQWNDDLHHAAHVVATGETGGYYGDYASSPVAALGRALAEGFAYQGEPSVYRDGTPRGEPSAHLPPVAFVAFLQNHDQIGNRALGDRLTVLASAEARRALMAILLLSPQVPLLFMGEEWQSRRPFLFFCDFSGELATAVRDGRRREFARFPAFADPAARERIPDPGAEETFAASRLDWSETRRAAPRGELAWTQAILARRREKLIPHLGGASSGGRFTVEQEHALRIDWTLGGGGRLHLAANLSDAPATGLAWTMAGECLHAWPESLSAIERLDTLPPWSVCITLEAAGGP